MRIRSLLVLLVAVCLALPAQAIEVDIIDLHQNTANGVPTMLGTEVTVRGIVTSPNYTYSSYAFEVYMQDATGGINIYVSSGADFYTAELGDSITVTAPVAQYNGLTELGLTTAVTTVTNHGGGFTVPEPLVITCADLEGTFLPDHSEPNEARLIRINNVTRVGGDMWPTSPSGSNSIIDISDGTATTLLFIDKDCEVNGSPDPGSVFDIVGVVKQFDYSSPYTSGYEISPRFLTDVLGHDPGPPVNGIVEIQELSTTGATLYFETASPGTSEIEYGLTDSYGNTAGDAGASELEHTVVLTGLDPNTIYHFRAKSSDAEGTRYGPDQLLATANDQPGEIHVYMSFTTDDTYAEEGNEVPSSQNLGNKLAALIGTAEYTVDACLYSFSYTPVRDALVAAHQRGCLVRLIIEDDNSPEAADYCASYGIPYITSTYGGNHGADDSYGIMHNKFVVIDGRDEDKYNDWIWTGSANMSISGNDDVNNVLEIQDYGLAMTYTMEFNEMWGSDTQTPNSAEAKFGVNKADDSPHEFRINGIRFEQYMSPSDGTEDQLEATAASADHSIYFAILAFTNYHLSDAMRDRRDALGGNLEIRGVFDDSVTDCEPTGGSMFWQMSGNPCSDYAWDVPADVLIDTALPSSRLMHHKYMLVDVNNESDDPTVATGSHNYSFSANSTNDENTLMIHDQSVANMFLQDFAQRYYESGGTGDLGTQVAVPDGEGVPQGRLLRDLTNYPNPFNPQTTISFTTAEDAMVSVKLYDAGGRLVRNLVDDQWLGAGLHIYSWNGVDDAGNAMPSGVYLTGVDCSAPLTGHNEKRSTKIILLD